MQPDLFGAAPPAFDASFQRVRRLAVTSDAWLDHAPAFVSGHGAVFDALMSSVTWKVTRREMYDRVVDVPRALASLPRDGALPPIVSRLQEALSRRYRVVLDHVTCALYRTGLDSVAMHADHVRHRDDALVAIVSVGAPRRFLLRANDGTRAWRFALGMGDLLVMGGATQRDATHGVPKGAADGPRISIMFRVRAQVDDERVKSWGPLAR